MKISVKIDDRIFEVEVVDSNARPVIAIIDGQTFEVWPSTQTNPPPLVAGPSQPVAAPKPPSPATPPAASSAKAVNAPLPGVIISLAVQAGDLVTVGQELCTLEAMKMKNVIYSARAGTVALVKVVVGQTVKHRDILMEYRD